ncbi:uracil phosphoribosyltransferase [Pseudopedobacter saltans DSM 12145]|uniref:Uracil phosphoribosyltransferase n=1 Tax=Pseudopedobacter saltans (strain ATCC 51119 / DSM 12145 / JCM 21818 / CCUG 39354 / LMG 10337 / NBRC 100064 / NCIMB 13643) TaxID=762903 RepID=F0SBB9_PSESL|nr:uracil phosphoribosyltransferase [Pseudopedobacter saltans]ADY53746.1 uracil phosphoribosyltransferase [Pseudopedobacter saltans DSM 12145]
MFVLTEKNSIANHFLSEMRNIETQKDRMRFRRNMERLGEIFAYEISKTLVYKNCEIDTPLGVSPINIMKDQPVLATILRAGLPFHQGFLNYFDHASSAFVSSYRKVRKKGDFIIKTEYISSQDLNNKILIISDPMLATGRSMVSSCKELLGDYKIKEMHIATIIASQEGIAHVKANLPHARLWIGAIDEELTSKAYIVPGLGDAGDLAFGEKI